MIGIVACGFAVGWFSLTLGSFVLWGIPIGIAFATAANWWDLAELLGWLFSLVWALALIVWLITRLVALVS
mgnify:FL=1